jgi:hypothetical protein
VIPGALTVLAVMLLSLVAAKYLGEFFKAQLNLQSSPVSTFLLAIILGMLLRNIIKFPKIFEPGFKFCVNKPSDWINGPGISVETARWFGSQRISAFGVETRSPGVIGVSNKEVHTVGGEMGYFHYENLVNLHELIGKGRFRFIDLPLKIRGGTGSPVRAIAVLAD